MLELHIVTYVIIVVTYVIIIVIEKDTCLSQHFKIKQVVCIPRATRGLAVSKGFVLEWWVTGSGVYASASSLTLHRPLFLLVPQLGLKTIRLEALR